MTQKTQPNTITLQKV